MTALAGRWKVVLNAPVTIPALAVVLYSLAAVLVTRELGLIGMGLFALVSAIPLMIYLLIRDVGDLLLGYVVLLPLIQELSFQGFKIGDFLVSPHMVVQLVVTVSVFTVALASYDPRQKLRLQSMDRLFLLFFLLTGFSLIYAYSLPVNHTKRWLLFYTGVWETVTFFFMVRYLLKRDGRMADKLVLALVLTAFPALVVAVREIGMVGLDVISIFLARMRIGFGYHNTNLFGIHSSIMVPITFYALRAPSLARYRWLIWPSFVIIMVLSLLCFNRGTFLVLGLELFLLYFIRDNRKILNWVMVAMVIAAVYFRGMIVFYLFRFLGGEADTGAMAAPMMDRSSMYRLEAWKVGLQVLWLYPFGVGAGGFQYAWTLLGTNPLFYLGTPHQLFLSIGVDYGVFALLAYVAILIVAFRYVLRLRKDPPEGSPPRLFHHLLISLVGFVCYGMVTDGELSHLTGFEAPNNGYTLVLFAVFALIAHWHGRLVSDAGSA